MIRRAEKHQVLVGVSGALESRGHLLCGLGATPLRRRCVGFDQFPVQISKRASIVVDGGGGGRRRTLVLRCSAGREGEHSDGESENPVHGVVHTPVMPSWRREPPAARPDPSSPMRSPYETP
ncbi:Uncharacterised protein [Mycobacteroides abscessus subsp. massiliense]|nr:Uncharacterised protein [Mycobacteroides abscessus subsp. massiliense]